MPIGDFIGTFPGYTHIPRLFQSIKDETKKMVPCKFNLKANVQEGVGPDQYFGIRKDKHKKALRMLKLDYKIDGWLTLIFNQNMF